jgi:GT2 family glycosyltransferase
MKKEDAWFDERFMSTWADTDLITRLYLTGKKMYRNFNCVVEHKPGQTEYKKPDHQSNFEANKERYKEKYKDHSDSQIYRVFTEGWIV